MMITPVELLLAFLLDSAIGDPRWLPHPVRGMGHAIDRAERMIRSHLKGPSGERLGGVILVVSIVIPAFLVALFITAVARTLPGTIGTVLGSLVLVYLVSTTIAVRELIAAVRLVIHAVSAKNIEGARNYLGMIVGRDTRNLSEREILKAAMETLSENLSDGIIAPLFYLVIGGLPLAIAYKAVNTLDSMVGYKNGRYLHFGWAAARLDDIANYLPARITGLLIVAATFIITPLKKGRTSSAARSSFAVMRRDGRNHTSPNSGIPEAAMAGAIGIRMGGPATYGGILFEKPYIGENRAEDYMAASELALQIAKATALLGIGAAAALLSLRHVS